MVSGPSGLMVPVPRRVTTESVKDTDHVKVLTVEERNVQVLRKSRWNVMRDHAKVCLYYVHKSDIHITVHTCMHKQYVCIYYGIKPAPKSICKHNM